jgi:hypothetical protein
MPIDSQHPEYTSNLNLWRKVRDCAEGSQAVKSGKTKYLPQPNPSDNSRDNTERYDAYVARASYVNFTGATLDGMLGMVFREPETVELPTQLEYLLDNANGAGLTLNQMARRAAWDLLATGREGLLVDYPAVESGLSVAEISSRNIQANILIYPAESVINWRTEVVGAITKLTMVVLREPTQVIDPDGYSSTEYIYHRVLRLDQSVYTSTLYDEQGAIVYESIPRKSDGSTWDVIPFIFCGAQNNDERVDKAPLLDIADLNIAHYHNSADFEESCFLVGQPTPVVAGLSQHWVEEVLKNGMMIGSRRIIPLPVGGTASLLQASPNQMPDRGMEMKELQLVRVGARLIQDNTGSETAEAAKIRFAGQNSKLGALVGNLESAIQQCLVWCAWFMGAPDTEIVYEMNREFYAKTADPQLIVAQIQLLDRGVIAMQDVRYTLREHGVLSPDRTDEDIDAEAEEQDMAAGFNAQNTL